MSQVQLHGMFGIPGSECSFTGCSASPGSEPEITIPLEVAASYRCFTATGRFVAPYVKRG